jgi:hypothetical protein
MTLRLRASTAIAFTALLAFSVSLASCSGIKTEAPEVNPTDMPKGPGLLSGESGNLLDAFKGNKDGTGSGGGVIGVNIYLWRAALESIAFMPITQADSNGGVIATDWYSQPDQPTERVRANILILGKTLRADVLKVSLFKQQKKGDSWQDVPVSQATVTSLEDNILTRARAIKVQTLNK